MTGMDAITLYGVILWAIFICCPVYIAWGITTLVRRWIRDRRRDREWAADMARRLREREYLDWAEAQFSSEEETALCPATCWTRYWTRRPETGRLSLAGAPPGGRTRFPSPWRRTATSALCKIHGTKNGETS